MTEQNRIVSEVELEVPGNPYLKPGDTIAVYAPSVGITSTSNLFLRHLTHTFNTSGFVSRLVLEGGLGEAGYETGRKPRPSFEMIVTRETIDMGAGPTDYYTVFCDGSSSTDPDDDVSHLSFSWSNNKNADTGSGVKYQTHFTGEEMADATLPAITLRVTDDEGNYADLTLEVDPETTEIVVRELYIAATTAAWATPDGGKTWNSAAIAAISTPEIAGESHSYFGCSGGELYRTDDWLATAPVLVHTFPAAVNCVWINEVNAERVTVGLANGQVWTTTDASAGAGATWTLLYTFGSAVNWVVESAYQSGQFWVCTAAAVWITFDGFASTPAWHFGWSAGASQKLALSGFGNYACASGTGGESAVKREDGVEITGIGADVRAITHHIRDDVLYGAKLNGADAEVYSTSPGSTAFSLLSTVTGAGQPNHMIRDGDYESELYLAAANGAYKSFDAGANFYLLKACAALQIGYGSAPWTLISDTVVTDTTWKCRPLAPTSTEPDNWRDPDFDDSGWMSAVVTATPTHGDIAGADSIWYIDTMAGAFPVTAEGGDTISGLVVSQEYSFENTDGPFHDGDAEPPTHFSYSFDLSVDGGTSWQRVLTYNKSQAFALSTPAWATRVEAVDAEHARIVWTATTTSIKYRVADTPGQYADNHLTMGWKLNSQCLYRKEFTLSEGIVNAATLTIEHDNYVDGLWINNVLVYQAPATNRYSGDPATVMIDPTVFLPGGDNIIAVKVRSVGTYYDEGETGWLQAKLVIGDG